MKGGAVLDVSWCCDGDDCCGDDCC